MHTLHSAISTIRTELRDSEQYKSTVQAVIAQCVIRAMQQQGVQMRFEEMMEIGKAAGGMVIEEVLKNK